MNTNETTTGPTPAAMRAAEKVMQGIVFENGSRPNEHDITDAALSIDRETGLPELLAALEETTDRLEDWWKCAGSPVHGTEPCIREARAIIHKAKRGGADG